MTPSPPLVDATPRLAQDLPYSGGALLGEDPRVADETVARRAREGLRARLFPDSASLVAPRIGRFTLLRELGRGGMGIVYVAYDETLDRRVALKLLYDLPASDPQAQTRLLHEAQAMARLNHPNIAAVYEAGTHEGRVFVAMEFIHGKPLDAWLRERPRPWRKVVAVFIQACRGLQAAHAIGLVHRDFKPANCMLGSDDRVRVLDFGLARGARTLAADTSLGGLSTMSVTLPVAPHQPCALTGDGTIVGTPAYMPPEQFYGQPIDHRADQFALCVSLYEGLYGRLPFRGETLPELWDAVLCGPPKAPPKGPRVPGWLHRTLLRGLDPEPERRFPTIAALLAALERRPGRRLRAGVLTGVGIGAFAAGLYGVDVYRNQQCVFDETELAGLWDDERRSALRAAFLREGSQAMEAWTVAEGLIDGHAQDWIDVQRKACEAHRQGIESSALYDRRRRCIAEFRGELATAIDILHRLEPKHEARVKVIMEALAKHPSCAPGSLGEWGTDPPASNQEADVDRLYGEFRRLTAKNMERYDSYLLDYVQNLSDEAEALGYEPLLVDVLRLRSNLEEQERHIAAACTTLWDSYILAEKTGRDLQAAHNARHMIALCADFGVGDRLSIIKWAEIARVKLRRAGKQGGIVHLNLSTALARNIIERGYPDDAFNDVTQGLDLVERMGSISDDTTEEKSIISHFFISSHYLGRVSDSGASREVRRRLHALMNLLYQDDEGLRTARVIEQEVFEHMEAGRWGEARERASRGRNELRGAAVASRKSVAIVNESLADAALASERCTDAADVVDVTEELASERSRFVAVAAQANCGNLQLAGERIIDFGKFVGSRSELFHLFATGLYAMEMGDAPAAVETLNLALAEHRRYGGWHGQAVYIRVLTAYAQANLLAGRNKRARFAARQAITQVTEMWGEETLALAAPLTVLGEVELAIGNFAEATQHLERALALRSGSDPRFRAETLFALSRALSERPGGTKRARMLGEQALAEYEAAGPRCALAHASVADWLAAL